MPGLDKDVHLTIELCGFLRAGYYAQIQFHSALVDLQSKILPEGYTDGAHKALDKIDPWLEDAARGLPILSTSWQAAETFDAISAMNFLQELKKDLLTLTPRLKEALAVPDLTTHREAVNLLVAGIVRSASARLAYAESFYRAYSAANAPDLAENAAAELPSAQEYAGVSQTILRTFTGMTAWPADLCEKLRLEALLTPSDFRAHIHDTDILLNVFSKEFTWEHAEFTRDEAQAWQTNGITPVAAGYWRAYDFAPQDFLSWQAQEIVAAPIAANWRRAGYTPARAINWIREGFPPSLALIWDQAGFEPAKAASFCKRGILDPAKAPTQRQEQEADQKDEDEW